MHRKLALILAPVAVAVVLGAASMPASAGEPPLQVSGTPAPGATITVSGTGCESFDLSPGQVTVRVLGGDPITQVGSANTNASPDGTWSIPVTIADTAQPGGDYFVTAECTRFLSNDPVSFDYQSYPFVMGQPVETTTTTTGPTSTTAPGGTAATSTATPRFTG